MEDYLSILMGRQIGLGVFDSLLDAKLISLQEHRDMTSEFTKTMDLLLQKLDK